ncbi:TadE/TadG family type IV pilus assembly protein [Actinocorallia longicatena]|uniref:TadE-like domain-containing protein n=1 Tax=Actinocorallia longicatena TaxID=111803 RepID=A0ABP6QLL3_9ACTN
MRRAGAENGDDGNMALELALLSPVLVFFFLLLVIVGKVVDVKSQLEGAARDGARAASTARSYGDAEAFTEQSVANSIDDSSKCVGGPEAVVTSGEGAFVPGGVVTVEVTCEVDLLWLGTIERKGTASAPLDTYRRIDCGGEPCEGVAE